MKKINVSELREQHKELIAEIGNCTLTTNDLLETMEN
jgi:hypothetical protein